MNRTAIIGVSFCLAAISVAVACFLWSRSPVSDIGPPADDSDKTKIGNQSFSEIEPLPQLPTTLANLSSLASPREDWSSEKFSELAAQQLATLATWMERHNELGQAALVELTTSDFQSDLLRPETLTVAYRDENTALEVRRSDKALSSPIPLSLEVAVDGLLAPYGPSPLHVELKIVRVELSDDRVDSLVLYHGAHRGRAPRQLVQQNAVWQVRWEWASPNEAPRLDRIRLEPSSFEEIVVAKQNTLFTDCTQSVLQLEGNRLLQQLLLTSQTHWTARLETAYGIDIGAFHGIALGDVNNDGLEDIYVCMPGGLPNRLLVQNPDGTVTDFSKEANVDFLDFTRHALLVDLDNDRDQDLVLLASSALLVLENEGRGRFQRRDSYSFASTMYSVSAADVDGDGLLDLHVTGRDEMDPDRHRSLLGDPVPYHDAKNGGSDGMLRNLGQLRFADVTEKVGLSDVRFSQAASWEDYDNDGDLDLYVANDFGRNALYENEGGSFSNVAAEAGVEDIAAGMSVSWGDYNQDGLMDLYVSNMFSSAGNRVAYQRRFQEQADRAVREQYRRHARGNSLFQNTGHGFRDVSMEAGVSMGRWAWSSAFCDLNNDGWQDIIVANGFVTNDQTDDL